MEFVVNDNIKIWESDIPIELYRRPMSFSFLPFLTETRIFIKDRWFDVISLSKMVRSRSEIDGNYHFIYIQINFRTGEYYIGKVNRKKWKELRNYKGSGLLFLKKYKKHTEEFVQYFIACCKTAEETEKLEAQIVNSELLRDPLCLNLVKGGGGTNKHNGEERVVHIREYLLAHPEQYQSMLARNKELYCSGPTLALKARNESIKATMSQDAYREMSGERINRWKLEHPEKYAASREKNRVAMQNEASKQKRNASLQKWREAHPKEYAEYRSKQIKAAHSEEAKAKRSKSLKEWNRTHPEEVKQRGAKAGKASQKAINMLDLKTGEVLKSFNSQQEAAEWLVQQGLAKSTNCKSSISAVCLKKQVPGHGCRKQTHGFGWEFKEEKKSCSFRNQNN